MLIDQTSKPEVMLLFIHDVINILARTLTRYAMWYEKQDTSRGTGKHISTKESTLVSDHSVAYQFILQNVQGKLGVHSFILFPLFWNTRLKSCQPILIRTQQSRIHPFQIVAGYFPKHPG